MIPTLPNMTPAQAEATFRARLQQQAAARYSTSVPASRSTEYQQWVQDLNQKRGKDSSGDSFDYDLTGAFLGGVQPDARGHLPDTYKKPNHMTFSSDSQYHTPDEPGGIWQDAGNGQWLFFASPTNLKYHSPAELTDYFNKYEPDSMLVLPPQAPLPAGLTR
jgi:hypothetical protein